MKYNVVDDPTSVFNGFRGELMTEDQINIQKLEKRIGLLEERIKFLESKNLQYNPEEEG